MLYILIHEYGIPLIAQSFDIGLLNVSARMDARVVTALCVFLVSSASVAVPKDISWYIMEVYINVYHGVMI